jgi:hypothetical protein
MDSVYLTASSECVFEYSLIALSSCSLSYLLRPSFLRSCSERLSNFIWLIDYFVSLSSRRALFKS